MHFFTPIACSPASPIVQVSHSGTGAYEAALARDERGLVVAWHDLRDGNAEIYVRSIDVSGRPIGPDRRLTWSPEPSYEPSIDAVGNEFAIAWYERPPGGVPAAMLGRWNREGVRQWAHPVAPASRNPVLRVSANTIFCAWIQAEPQGGEAVWAGWWTGDGRPLRPATRLGRASMNTWNLNAAIDARQDAWVVFDAGGTTSSNEVYLVRLGASDVQMERLTRDDGAASTYPDVAIDADGRAALTWFDERDGNQEVYLLATTTTGLTGEVDGRARRVTRSPGESIGAYVSWNKGRIGLAWSDQEAGQHDVYFQLFDASANPLAPARRMTASQAWSLVPAIRPWRDGFALAWNEYSPASAGSHEGTSEVAFTTVTDVR